jgi:hypothetical protein
MSKDNNIHASIHLSDKAIGEKQPKEDNAIHAGIRKADASIGVDFIKKVINKNKK